MHNIKSYEKRQYKFYHFLIKILVLFCASATINIHSEEINPATNYKLLFANNYAPIYSGAKLRFPSYKLNISLNKISNYYKIQSLIPLNNEMEESLKTEGCLIIPSNKFDQFHDTYHELIEKDIPIFITSDTFLFFFKYYFTSLLINAEENYLCEDLSHIASILMQESEKIFNSSSAALQKAAKKNLILFATANKLLNDESLIPNCVKDIVNSEYASIQTISNKKYHNKIDLQKNKDNVYSEIEQKYSHFIPAGHYAANPKLQKYYQALQWLKQNLLIVEDKTNKNYDGNKPTQLHDNFKINILQILLLSANLSKLDKKTLEAYQRLISVYSYFYQTNSELTPLDCIPMMEKIFGPNAKLESFLDDTKLNAFIDELKKQLPQKNFAAPLTYETTIRFLPETHDSDSIILSKLISNKSGKYTTKHNLQPITLNDSMRILPFGIGLMSLLGASKANTALLNNKNSNYSLYEKELSQFKRELMTFNITDWHQNLYWCWLSLIKTLLIDFLKGYPSFMKTDQWYNKELNTALSSWALLRSDPYLTPIKGPATNAIRVPPSPIASSSKNITDGFVEPVPDFYSELLAITKTIHKSLKSLNLLNELPPYNSQYIEDMLTRVLEISRKQLRLETLNDNDLTFLKQLVDQLPIMLLKNNADQTKLPVSAKIYIDKSLNKSFTATISRVNLLLVIYITADKRALIAAGPVLSYSEGR